MFRAFKSLADFQTAFPDEDTCINHFRSVRWPDGNIVCPKCGAIGLHYTLADNTHKCRDCQKQFSVRHGTIFGESKVELRKWFIAIFIMTSHKKGVSSCQLARDIGVTQKTAWFMLHRVRNATMTAEFNAPLSGVVEVDECFVGPKPKWQHADKKKDLRGMAASNDKKIVFGMHQRGGDLRLVHVPDIKHKTTIPLVTKNIRRGAEVHTDESSRYSWMSASYMHSLINHSLGQYVKDDVTTNRIEGAFSHFRRTMIGTYHQASVQHLDSYLQMFAFRWNRRTMSESERMNDLLRATKDRRLTYDELIHRKVH